MPRNHEPDCRELSACNADRKSVKPVLGRELFKTPRGTRLNQIATPDEVAAVGACALFGQELSDMDLLCAEAEIAGSVSMAVARTACNCCTQKPVEVQNERL